MTDLSHFTDTDVLRVLREVVEEFGGDYIYKHLYGDMPCRYVEEKKGQLSPSCIAGHVFYRLGVPLEVLADYDEDSFGNAADVVGEKLGLPDTASRLLRAAQALQDCEYPWGEALRSAEEIAGTR